MVSFENCTTTIFMCNTWEEEDANNKLGDIISIYNDKRAQKIVIIIGGSIATADQIRGVVHFPFLIYTIVQILFSTHITIRLYSLHSK